MVRTRWGLLRKSTLQGDKKGLYPPIRVKSMDSEGVCSGPRGRSDEVNFHKLFFFIFCSVFLALIRSHAHLLSVSAERISEPHVLRCLTARLPACEPSPWEEKMRFRWEKWVNEPENPRVGPCAARAMVSHEGCFGATFAEMFGNLLEI